MTETIETNDGAVDDVEEVAEDAAETTETEEDNSQESDAEGEDTAEEEDTQDDDEDEEAPTRKPRTNADWVAHRRQQKLDKQKAGKSEQGEADDEDSDEEDDDVNDEDAKLIDKRIDQRLAPIEEATQAAEVKAEIDQFVADNPDFKPFAAKAAKWAKHPSYKDLPTKQLMFAAAGDKLLKIGADRAKAVTKKTQKTKTGAGNAGSSGGAKPVSEMTDEEFEQEVTRVKTQTRKE